MKRQTVYRRGTITVFLGMTIMMVISIFFSLVEVVHVDAVKGEIEMASDLGVQSMLADYNRMLWKDYGILAVDSGYGTENMNLSKMEERMFYYADDNSNPISKSIISEDVSFLKAAVTGCTVESYGLITDNQATPFIKMAAKNLITDIPESILNELIENGDTLKSDTEAQRDIWEIIDEGKTSYEDALDGEDAYSSESMVKTPQKVDNNPLDSVESFRNSPILGQVLPSNMISDKSFTRTKKVSLRSINRGNTSNYEEINLKDKALFPFYIKEKFQRYGNEMNHLGISYEWEYLLSGKDSDYENLEAIVLKLLAARSAENLAAIMSDPGKIAEASSLAAAIAGATLNPAIIKGVEMGIIAAWAYLESVLDVRLLLSGGRVSLLKTPGEWTSRIAVFSNYIGVDVKAKECASGLTYEDYLMLMTYTSNIGKIGMRALDVLEDALRATDDYAKICIDNMIYCANIEFSYESSPIFLSPVIFATGNIGKYTFYREKEISYL